VPDRICGKEGESLTTVKRACLESKKVKGCARWCQGNGETLAERKGWRKGKRRERPRSPKGGRRNKRTGARNEDWASVFAKMVRRKPTKPPKGGKNPKKRWQRTKRSTAGKWNGGPNPIKLIAKLGINKKTWARPIVFCQETGKPEPTDDRPGDSEGGKKKNGLRPTDKEGPKRTGKKCG